MKILLKNKDKWAIRKPCHECEIEIVSNPSTLLLVRSDGQKMKLPFHSNCLIKGKFLYGFLKECKKIAKACGQELSVNLTEK